MTIDVSDTDQVPEELLNIGFFYVENDRVIRMLELSETEKKRLLIHEEIPDSATVVCQDNEIKDKYKGKGWHEQVYTNKELVAYNCWNDEQETGFYERILWKKNVGIIFYTRGFGAERDAIIMWRDEYVEKPHELNLTEIFK